MSRSLAMEILSAIASSARQGRHREEDGPDADRDFEVGEFEAIEIAAPFDVDIRIGGGASVHASGPENLLEEILVEVHHDRLFIGCDGDCDADVQVSVTVPRLRSLRTSGSGDVSVDKVKADDFE
ncbi:MAG TPA: DUF2807 domain-containing protein, partial [Sphingomicrobium sp.]|nr:DUF2807 domain-containing protein [Sphingomicrobium sp.]